MPDAHTHQPWYEEWFDDPHYHQLYGHRSKAEAKLFIEAMHQRWDWARLSLLDLACGKGRHAKAAADLGHEVLGVDLSPNSIAAAKEEYAGTANLDFAEGDMRTFELDRTFDGVLNLFTSFGYFSTEEEHLAVLKAIHRHIKPGGFLVLDFLDVAFAQRHLVPSESLERSGVTYEITRNLEPGDANGHPTFVKRIRHQGPNGPVEHTERVAALGNAPLSSMLERAGFQILERYGSYDLSPWEAGETPRLIIRASKP
ncbi:MAG: class I SAM-dependent methyltransferase [Flavobacteriales bacterium]|nr:class I SAM-dependent methyltransferase [Flavobacteriales bacterium]